MAWEKVYEEWKPLSDGEGDSGACTMQRPQGKARGGIVRTKARALAAKEQIEQKVKKTQEQWEKQLWHRSHQEFACEQDAQKAWKQAMKGKPSFVVASVTREEQGQYQQKGRPKKDAVPDKMAWHLVPPLTVDPLEIEILPRRQASFIIATNLLDEQSRSHDGVFLTSQGQGGVERGYRFLKDPPLPCLLCVCHKA
jgi:transposase